MANPLDRWTTALERQGHPPDAHVTRLAVRAGAALTLGAGVVELSGSWLGHSLFLAADAIHLVAHMGIYGALLLPGRAAGRAEERRTAAVLSVVCAIAVGIVLSSVRSLVRGKEAVAPLSMLLSLVGLFANVATAWLFRGPARQRVSFRAALVHELSDGAMTIVGLLGALVIWLAGWVWVDPALSLMIGLWLLVWAARLLSKTLRPVRA